MDLLNKSDDEILEIANPFWDDLITSSNKKDYNAFTRNFSKDMLMASNEVEPEPRPKPQSGFLLGLSSLWIDLS